MTAGRLMLDGTKCYTENCSRHADAIREATLTAKQAKERTRDENEFIARRQWHPTKNARPYDETSVTPLSTWQCPVAADHEWEMPKGKRLYRGDGCPFCSGHRASSTNNLTLRPDLAAELDEDAAGVMAREITLASNQMLPWRCTKAGHRWVASPNTRQTSGCAKCQLRHFDKYPSFEASVAGRYPQLVAFFDEKLNGITAAEANGALDKSYWWTCSNGHSQERTIANRVALNATCTRCSGRSIDFASSLAGRFPDIALLLNEPLSQVSAASVHPGSAKRLMWNCPTGDPSHVHDASPREKTGLTNAGAQAGCPFCSNHRLSSTNHLLAVAPHIAPEFDEERNGMRADEVIAGSNTPVWWNCLAGKGHASWRTSPNLRTGKGKTGCPRCNPWSTSKPEGLFRGAFTSSPVFKSVIQDSNATVPIYMKNNRKMKVDVLGTLKNGDRFVAEYDGAYYHYSSEALARDTEKTIRLLNAGYVVVRIRENALSHLSLAHPNLFQLNHSAKRSHAALDETVTKIEKWLTTF